MTEPKFIEGYLRHLARLRAGHNRPSGMNYFGPEDLVEDRGTLWDWTDSSVLTPEEDEILFKAVDAFGGRFQIKQCYFNAQMLLACDHTDQLQYWEGFAQGNATIPLHHGWVVINKKVIDLTWKLKQPRAKGRLRNRVQGVIPEGWVYMGVHISKESLVEEMCRTGMTAGVLFNSHLDLYELPRKGAPPVPFLADLVEAG